MDLKPGCFFLFLLFSSASFGQSPNSMSLELSIPHSGQLAWINDCSGKKDLFVIIHNNTDTTNYFYEDWNSYGYYNISFEIKTKDAIYEVVRPKKLWYRNYKSYFILNPGESLVFPYLLADTACTHQLRKNKTFEDGWIGFPPVKDTVEIRAVYQLCRLEDSIPDEIIGRLSYRERDYIDYLDGDIEFEQKSEPVKKVEEPKQPVVPIKTPDSKGIIIFNKPILSEWQKVILK